MERYLRDYGKEVSSESFIRAAEALRKELSFPLGSPSWTLPFTDNKAKDPNPMPRLDGLLQPMSL